MATGTFAKKKTTENNEKKNSDMVGDEVTCVVYVTIVQLVGVSCSFYISIPLSRHIRYTNIEYNIYSMCICARC